MTDVWGYADLHCHPMAHLGFGGMHAGKALFWGEPTGPVEQALRCCNGAHDILQSGSLIAYFVEHRSAGYDGWPGYGGWPRATTLVHQQMYVDGIRRAYDGGLRFMVASAVSNELLGDLYQGSGIDSSDRTAITAQLAGMRTLAQESAAWLAIVSTPAEARQVIAQGKLAVVLAIEVDSLAGGDKRPGSTVDAQAADALIAGWFAAGVRLINPLHLADNALGGCAVFDDRYNLSNHYLTAKYASHTPGDWFFGVDAHTTDLDGVQYLLGADTSNDLLIQLYGKGYPSYVKDVRRDGHVNARGLTDSGRNVLRAMMRRGMLVDVDHMSAHTLDGTIALAQQFAYPLVSTHSGVRAIAVPRPSTTLHVKGCGHEGMKSDRQLAALKALGSAVALAAHIGPVAGLDLDASSSWAKSYRHLVGLGFDAVAVGTDMNGFAQAPGPRFGRDAHGTLVPLHAHDPVRPIAYGQDLIPFTHQILQRTALGTRAFDLNTDGLAQYAMLPDFVLDLALDLGGEAMLTAFYRSAEKVLRVWETCISQSTHVPPV